MKGIYFLSEKIEYEEINKIEFKLGILKVFKTEGEKTKIIQADYLSIMLNTLGSCDSCLENFISEELEINFNEHFLKEIRRENEYIDINKIMNEIANSLIHEIIKQS